MFAKQTRRGRKVLARSVAAVVEQFIGISVLKNLRRPQNARHALQPTFDRLETRLVFGDGWNFGPTLGDNDTCPPVARSNAPIVYSSGRPVMQTTDLASDAFGSTFSQSRSWTGTNEANINGNGWALNELGFLALKRNQVGHSAIISLAQNGSFSKEFNVVESSPYTITPKYETLDQLVYVNPTTSAGIYYPGEYKLYAQDGSITTFYDLPRLAFAGHNYGKLSSGAGYTQKPTNQWFDGSGTRSESATNKYRFGAFKSYTDPSGKLVVTAEFDANANLKAVIRTDGSTNFERWSYELETVQNDANGDSTVGGAGDATAQLIGKVTLQRGTGSTPYDATSVSTWTAVRSVDYEYYTGTVTDTSSKYGRMGDLKLATISEAKAVTSITSSSGTATVTLTNHGYSNSDQILISDASQSEYNGWKTITVTSDDTFTYTVSGSPASPATPTSTLQITAAKSIEQKYYRYNKFTGTAYTGYTDLGPTNGYSTTGGIDVTYAPEGGDWIVMSGLKSVFEGASYARLSNDLGSINTIEDLPDSSVNPYAQYIFQYQRFDPTEAGYPETDNKTTRYRVVQEIAAAEGCSTCSDGFGVYKFEYQTLNSYNSTDSSPYANWVTMRTTEWLSDATNELVNKTLGANELTSSGTTATVTWNSHGFIKGEDVTIAGANQSAYNGTFEITAILNANTFTVTLLSAPGVSPATGTITVTNLDRIDPAAWDDNDRHYVYTNRLGASLIDATTDGDFQSVTDVTYDAGIGSTGGYTVELAGHGYEVGDKLLFTGVLSGTRMVAGSTVVSATTDEFDVFTSAWHITGKRIELWTDIEVVRATASFKEYTSSNRVARHAMPSAILGWEEGFEDLIGLNGIVLNNDDTYYETDSGLVYSYEYGTSETGSLGDGDSLADTNGNVVGYLKSTSVLKGFDATAIPTTAYTYYKQTNGTSVIYPLATLTKYWDVNANGTLGAGEGTTTSYTYERYVNGSATNRIEKMTIHHPAVDATRNGSGTAFTEKFVYDFLGRNSWHMDGDGFIDYREFGTSGGISKEIIDVNTTTSSNEPSGWTNPGTGGRHLTTNYVLDGLGRATKTTDPKSNVTYTIYNDADHEVRVYSGWNATTGFPTGPTIVKREDWGRAYTESLTMSATPDTTGSSGSYAPSGDEAIAKVQSLSRNIFNNAGQHVETNVYVSMPSAGYSATTAHIGSSTNSSESGNYYETFHDYNGRGQLKREENASGTITRYIYDSRENLIQKWVGTDDEPSGYEYWEPGITSGVDLVLVEERAYDQNSNLIRLTAYPDDAGTGEADRATLFAYDWRDRAVASKVGALMAGETNDTGNEDADTQRLVFYNEYDNLDRLIALSQYDGDGINIYTDSGPDGVPDAPSSSLLRAKSKTYRDDRGQVYHQEALWVDPDTGSIGGSDSLDTWYWFDGRGNTIKSMQPGGLITKNVFNGAGWLTTSYLTDGVDDVDPETSGTLGSADDVSGDHVVQQTENTFDDNGNLIQVTTRHRIPGQDTLEGALGDPSSSSPTPKARVYHVVSYYDSSDRLIRTVNVGTYGAASYTRPSTSTDSANDRADVTLVNDYSYAADAVQQIKLTGAPTGGTFTLTFDGQTTSSIAYNASAATVLSALEALSNIASGDVSVLALADKIWLVRFIGATMGGKYQNQMTITPSLTGGTSPSGEIRTMSVGGDAGRLAKATDPKSIVAASDYNLAGQVLLSVAAYADSFTPTTSTNQITRYAYNGLNQTTNLKAILPDGSDSGSELDYQETKYVYGVTVASGSTLASNDLLGEVWYPRKTASGSDPAGSATDSGQKEVFDFNRFGERINYTDRNGSVHEYDYDVVGRLGYDYITTFGSGVSTWADKLTFSFDSAGRPKTFTTRNVAALGGTDANIINQVKRKYDGFGNVIIEYQDHDGAVDDDGTAPDSPKVEYGFTVGATDAGGTYSRKTTMTYPDTSKIHFGYGASDSINDNISRLDLIARDNSGSVGTHIEEITYMGLATAVERVRTEGQTKLSYVDSISWGSTDPREAGDGYEGLDRFGRISDQRWIETNGSASDIERFRYYYDRNGNAIFKENLVSSSNSELYSSDAAAPASAYDNLNRLLNFQRGTLSDSGDADSLYDTVSTSTRIQAWTLDALGNWSTIGAGTTSVSNTNRTHNGQNQITAAGSTSYTHDTNGNLKTEGTSKTYTYDGWNRLKGYTGTGSTFETYTIDALGRRITWVNSVNVPTPVGHRYYSVDWQVILEETLTPDQQGGGSLVGGDGGEEQVMAISGPVDGSSDIASNRRLYVWSNLYVDALILRDTDSAADGTYEQTIYAQQDHNFNVTSLADTSGAVIQRMIYDPYGTVQFKTNAWGTSGNTYTWSYLHQGGRQESSALINFRHRDLSTTLGRWIQQDPLEYIDGANLYAAYRSSPINFVDPNGLFFEGILEVVGGYGGAVVGAAVGGGLGGAAGSRAGKRFGPFGPIVGRLIGAYEGGKAGGKLGYGVGTSVGGGIGQFIDEGTGIAGLQAIAQNASRFTPGETVDVHGEVPWGPNPKFPTVFGDGIVMTPPCDRDPNKPLEVWVPKKGMFGVYLKVFVTDWDTGEMYD